MSNFTRIVKRHNERCIRRGINTVRRLGMNMQYAALFYQKEFAAYEKGYDEGWKEAKEETNAEATA